MLKGDPATVAELRQEVMKDLEDVKDEIEELLELKVDANVSGQMEHPILRDGEVVCIEPLRHDPLRLQGIWDKATSLIGLLLLMYFLRRRRS